MKRSKILFSSIFASFLAIAAFSGVMAAKNTQHVEKAEAATYFTPNSLLFFRATNGWFNDGAWTAAYFFNDSEGTNYWVACTSDNYFTNGIKFCTVPSGNWEKVIFVRMASGQPLDKHWDAKWNQTGNLSAGNGDMITVSGGLSDSTPAAWSSFGSYQTWQVAYGEGSSWSQTYTVTLGYKNDGDGAQFYSTNVTLNSAHQFQIKRSSPSEGWFGSSYILDGGAVGEYFEKGSGNNNIVVKKNGTFEFYVKIGDQNVWTQISSVTQADAYAQEFLSKITCSSSSTTFSINAWNIVGAETTSMEYKYLNNISKGARDLLTSATPNQSGSNIEQCAARYDRILSKYGYGDESGKYHDFMGRKPSLIAGRSLIAINNVANNTTIIVVVVVGVAALAVGGYFLLRKKKEN